MKPRTVSAENFLATVECNVNNEKLTDTEFRDLIRISLPIVKFDNPQREDFLNKELLKKCIDFATEKHSGQKRANGDDYITHPLAVSGQLSDTKLKIIAVLHDVIEDTDATLSDLKDLGLNQRLINSIILLTKEDGVGYKDYLDSIKLDRYAREVKIADIKDNLKDIDSVPSKLKLKDKYILALYYLEN